MKSVGTALAVALLLLATACADTSNPSRPTSTTPPPPPVPTTFTLSGTVTSTGGQPINGASVRIDDGPNAGRSTTTAGGGVFTLSNLTRSGFTLNVSAPDYDAAGAPVTLTSNQTMNVQLTPTPPAPIFNRAGVGDATFDLPASVRRIEVVAIYEGNSSSFTLRIAGTQMARVLMGTYWGQTRFFGTYAANGGLIQIQGNGVVSWTVNEVR
jgi:Carboxypeptidase regulatory-like domain